MQIHKLEVRFTNERVLDPTNGRIVMKRHEYLGPGTTNGVTYENQGYQIQDDGTFEVPDEVGAYYLKRDGWFEGPNPFAEDIAAEAERNSKAEAEAKQAEADRVAAEVAAAEKSKAEAEAKAAATKPAGKASA